MATEKYRIKQIPKEIRKQDLWSRRAYVDWVNDKLKAHYTNALEFRNGALYIQLLDSIFPGAIPLDDVKFSAHMEYDCFQNFRMLEEAFRKLGIDKNIDPHALSTGRHVESWSFLKWFKTFYDNNFDGKEYDPVKARKNAYMGFGKAKAKPEISETSPASKRKSYTLTHARSKSMVFQRDQVGTNETTVKKGKTCRSMESMHSMRQAKNVNLPNKTAKKGECGERDLTKVKQKYLRLFPKKQNVKETPSKSGSTSTGEGSDEKEEKSAKEATSKSTVHVRNGESQGDFEPKIATKLRETKAKPKNKEEEANVNAVVVNKSQTYEDFGVRITENIQIRVESSCNIPANSKGQSGPSDAERRRKINLMIEKFLKYQCVERKEYFQTLAEFIRDDKRKSNK